MEFDRCADDVTYWLDATRHWTPYCFTKDEHPLFKCSLCGPDDLGHAFNKQKGHLREIHGIDEPNIRKVQGYFVPMDPIRPFPLGEPRYQYMRPIIDVWQQEQLLLVQKSRDMMASWLFIALYTWDTLYHKARQNFMQSENAAKTRDLVKRGFHIYKSQPKFLRDVAPAGYAIGPFNAGVVTIDELGSELVGLPEGAGQVRQYHPSGIYTDETAFHKDAGETFAAVKPAIQAGGRYTGVSSAYPGWFQIMCQDMLQTEDL